LLITSFVLLGALLAGPLAASNNQSSPWSTNLAMPASAPFDHIVTIMMENQAFCSVYTGCGGSGTYQSQLADQNVLVMTWGTINHNSQPNYIALFGAINDGSTSGDGVCCYFETGQNLVDKIEGAGLTWQAFAEDAGSSGTCSFSPPRSGDHFPFIDFSDMNTASRCSHFLTTASSSDPEFLASLNTANPANFIWLTPNDNNNGHDSGVSGGDSYLAALVPKILASTEFTTTKATLLVLYDEGYSQCANTGGNGECVYASFSGPAAKKAVQISPSGASHYSYLSTIEAAWGLSSINSNDAGAPTMLSAFNAACTTNCPPPPLSTSFAVSPSLPLINLPVSFTATTTGGTPAYSISWNFGDGATGNGISTTHVYLGPQSATVTETATDSSSPSQTATSSKTITITAPPPLSTSFTLIPSNPVVNAPVAFTSTTTGATAPYTVAWNFGDGATGTGATATHTYTTAQSFAVTETATDSSTPTQTATSSKTIMVVTSLPLSTSFTFLPANPTVNSPVSFTAVTTGGTLPYIISWNFGDGGTATGATATHAYAIAQSFSVTETSTDSSSPQQTATATHTVTVSSSLTGNFDNKWFINNCPGGTETISNGVLQTRQSTPGGGSNSYGYCTGQRGTFPWGSTVGTALPAGITSVTVSFNFLSRSLLSGSRYHLYVALYYRIPSSTSGGTTYSWLDTQSRIENIGGTDSPLGTIDTYDPGDSFGWDIVTLQANPGQTGILTADATQLCQGDLAAWGLPANTQCTLAGIEIGTEGYLVNSVNVDWYNVGLNIGSIQLSTSFTISPSTPLVNKPVTFTSATVGGTAPYTISWNFGDGTSGTGTSVTHTYSTVQTFTVTETATDSSSPSQTTTSSKPVTTSTPPPPSTSFTSSPTSPTINSLVTFTSTTSGGTAPYSIAWTFGDGGSATGATVTHAFTSAQSFTITETATDSSSPPQTATSSKTVTVSPPPPLSTSFTFLPATPLVNTLVTFTAVTTGGTSPYTVTWNFGDGTTGSGTTVTHTFTTAQSFTVTETATDSSSPRQTATSSRPLTVYTTPPLSAAISASTSSPQIGQTVTFTASATGGTTPYSYAISFGDGATSTGRSPTHTYSTAGSYTVTLTVTDSASPRVSSFATLTVYVQALLPPALALPGNRTGISGSWINFTVTATSPEPARTVTLSASQLPTGATFDSSTGVFSWKPSASQTGYYTISFIATDDSAPPMSSTSPMGIQVNQAAPGGSGGGGSGGGSNGGCTWCPTIPVVSNSMWLLMIGGLLGLVTSLSVLTIRARASLEHTKRRLNRMRIDD